MTLPVIAIGGPHGSGKSSVAKRIADEFEMNYVAAGDVFREMAKEQNYSLKEFSKLALDQPEIDRQIDERTKKLGKKSNTIVDAQLAAHFTPDADLKICITASPQIRYERIAKREEKTVEEAKKETEVREATERKRFRDLYDIDIDSVKEYDIIINTNRLDFQATVKLTRALVQELID